MCTLEKRFWEKVEKSDGCWNWVGHVHPLGYGKIKNGGRKNCKVLIASRVSWEIHNGPIPNGLCVLHKCDNRKCVRPDHLFIGTKGDNNRDRHFKGRDWKMPSDRVAELQAIFDTPASRSDFGESNVNAKLTADAVTYARLNPDGMMVRELAAKFGVNTKTIHDAIIGKSWRHVRTPPRIPQ